MMGRGLALVVCALVACSWGCADGTVNKDGFFDDGGEGGSGGALVGGGQQGGFAGGSTEVGGDAVGPGVGGSGGAGVGGSGGAGVGGSGGAGVGGSGGAGVGGSGGGGSCGNNSCDPPEDCMTCPADCGPCGPICGDMTCDANENCMSCPADCGPCGCAHDKCVTGQALVANCEPCVGQICAADPFCCNNSWDNLCVDEVQSVCMLTCPTVCGDNSCDPGEDCMNCPADCGPCPVCGDLSCDPGEDCMNCPGDCGQCGQCAHDKCVTGQALVAACDPCVGQICGVDPFCCNNSWDNLCVGEVQSVCMQMCGGNPVCGDNTCDPGEDCVNCPGDCGPCPPCAHDKCVTGSALVANCEACVGQICAADPFCCNSSWDNICVGEVQSVCMQMCGPNPVCGDNTCDPGEDCMNCPGDCGPCPPVCGNNTCEMGEDCMNCPADCGPCGCAHDKCVTGSALVANCEPCVGQICAADPFCCNNSWDNICVGEVQSVCMLPCGGGGCAHDKCVTGSALAANCDPCVGQICGVDPFCCNNSWDNICVGEVQSVCMQTCI
jgi:hypothetical protein